MQNENLTLEFITKSGDYETVILDEQEQTDAVTIDWQRTQVRQHDITTGDETIKIKIASIHGWPEFKTEMVLKCKYVLGVKVCTKVPVAYRRQCTKAVFAVVSFPGEIEDTIKREIKNCGIKAAAVAVAAAIAGGVAAALPVFSSAFGECIQASAGEYASRVRFKLDDETSCGDWKPY
jgi:hypothetical protein